MILVFEAAQRHNLNIVVIILLNPLLPVMVSLADVNDLVFIILVLVIVFLLVIHDVTDSGRVVGDVDDTGAGVQVITAKQILTSEDVHHPIPTGVKDGSRAIKGNLDKV